MLPGLTDREYEALLLSVGGGLKARRPLSPVEVGQLCAKAEAAGASKKEITAALRMTDTSMVPKFIRLTELSPAIRHQVDWGRSRSSAIGFSVAAQLGRLEQTNQDPLAELILRYRLSKAEMVSVIQLLRRSGQPLGDCVDRVVQRRPAVIVRHVVLGAVLIPGVARHLARLSQLQRDESLARALKATYPTLQRVTAKLGVDRFTIVGGRSLAESIGRDGGFEATISRQLARQLATNGS